MSKQDANKMLAATLNNYVANGGKLTEVVGWDAVKIQEVADAFAAAGFAASAKLATAESKAVRAYFSR